MKIFLIGLPGSGKTTIGKMLAKALNVNFVDLDKEIEKEEGIPLSEIFQAKKEDYFRKIESAELKRLCKSPSDFVMATGGGTPCFFDNMEVINRSGTSIFLDVSAREVAGRMLKSDLAKRPLLAHAHDDEVKDRIEFLRSSRITFYKQAHLTIGGEQISTEDIIRLIELKKENQK
jgi:shikimate kinase